MTISLPELRSGYLAAMLRNIATNHRIFHVFAFIYQWMNSNPLWMDNSTRLLTPLSVAENIIILDLGAGPGNSALAMGAERPKTRFVAFDLAPSMVVRAQRSARAAGWPPERMTPIQGNAESLPLDAGSVAAVTAHSFLYLLSDYQTVLAEAERVLSPNGLIALLEPNAGAVSWLWLLRQRDPRVMLSLSLWRLYSWMHRRFSAEDMRALLELHDFHSVSSEETLGGFGLFTWARKKSE